MKDLLSSLLVGGPVVVLLLSFSVLALMVCVVKLMQLWMLRELPRNTVALSLDRLVQGDTDTLKALAKKVEYSRAYVCDYALQLAMTSNLSLDQIKAEAWRVAKRAVAKRNDYLRILDVIATVAPLLGLLGTVLGMITAFQAMEAAGSNVDPAVLSGGIWLALLTTAVGVGVAIPVSLAHSWFERKMEVFAATLQDDIERIFTVYATGVLGKRAAVAKLANAS